MVLTVHLYTAFRYKNWPTRDCTDGMNGRERLHYCATLRENNLACCHLANYFTSDSPGCRSSRPRLVQRSLNVVQIDHIKSYHFKQSPNSQFLSNSAIPVNHICAHASLMRIASVFIELLATDHINRQLSIPDIIARLRGCATAIQAIVPVEFIQGIPCHLQCTFCVLEESTEMGVFAFLIVTCDQFCRL